MKKNNKQNNMYPSEKDFVEKNRSYSGEKNAKLIYNLLINFGEFPDSYDGPTVNNFLNSINSNNMHSLLKEIQRNSISQKRQFIISIVVSIIAMITAVASLYVVINGL